MGEEEEKRKSKRGKEKVEKTEEKESGNCLGETRREGSCFRI